MDSLFLHDRFWFSTSGESLRAAHLSARPAVIAAHFVDDAVAVVVHGAAHVVVGGSPEALSLQPYWRAVHDGGVPEDWVPQPAPARYVRIDPVTMVTFCSDRTRLAALTGRRA